VKIRWSGLNACAVLSACYDPAEAGFMRSPCLDMLIFFFTIKIGISMPYMLGQRPSEKTLVLCMILFKFDMSEK